MTTLQKKKFWRLSARHLSISSDVSKGAIFEAGMGIYLKQ
jgi:hypothetical protein